MAVVTVAFEDLDTWLSQQPDNTPDTPYELNILNPKYGRYGIRSILINNPTKYVDLRSTEIWEETSLYEIFKDCTTLVYPPNLENHTGIRLIWDFAFYGCTSLKEVRLPDIPPFEPTQYITKFSRDCFIGCTSLTTVYVKNVVYSSDLANYCGNLFEGCTNLSKFYSDNPYELKTLLTELRSINSDYFPNDPDNCTFNLFSTPAEIDVNDLANELSVLPQNTASSPYEIKVTGLTSSRSGTDIVFNEKETLNHALSANYSFALNKYVDLSSTIFPSDITNLDSVFYFCASLVKSPALPKDLISMPRAFVNCLSLAIAPAIPKKVENLSRAFERCRSLTTAPLIPEGVSNLSGTFSDCDAITTAPLIPDGVVNMNLTFFGCNLLTVAPILPESVERMQGCFMNCTSLRTVPNVPKNVKELSFQDLSPTIIRRNYDGAFEGCSALEEITSFEADLESIMNNKFARDVFKDCTSLTKIGIPSTPVSESDDWHIFSLNFGASTVEGKVYDKDGTSHNLPQTQIVKSDLKLPILTDELWFPTEYTDAQLEAIIQKMITYRYGVFNKETIPPDEKTFVLQADNPAHFRSNLPFVKESDVVDTVASGNLHSVTSNAVFNELHKIVARTRLPIEPTQGEEFAGENVYDVEYEGGLHHVSGIFVVKSTVNFSNRVFTTAKALSQVSGGNYMWFPIVTNIGKTIMGRITWDGGVHLWGGVTFTEDLFCSVDFWYKDNTAIQQV